MDEPRSAKHERARNSLPEDLRPVFDDFVAGYWFVATKFHGSPFVSYIVLAEMVRAGWRLVAEPIQESAKRGVADVGRFHYPCQAILPPSPSSPANPTGCPANPAMHLNEDDNGAMSGQETVDEVV